VKEDHFTKENTVPEGVYWFKLVGREVRLFLRISCGSLITAEFLRLLIPFLILWEIIPRTGIVPRSLVPAFSDVCTAFVELYNHKNLLFHLCSSLGNIFFGLLLAIATAIPIGIMIGLNAHIRKHLLPLFQILAPIPPPAWVPITIAFLGIGLSMKLFLVFLGAFYPILFNTYQAIRDTDPRYITTARAYGASGLSLIRHVYVWNSLGAMIMSVRTGAAMGLVVLVTAEIYGGGSGIGFLLVEAKEFFQIPAMVVCMIILGGIGWFIQEVLKYAELKLSHWKNGGQVDD
jgi:ABC-type nitrate/sulfonate/bicarbonate transport system permease component